MTLCDRGRLSAFLIPTFAGVTGAAVLPPPIAHAQSPEGEPAPRIQVATVAPTRSMPRSIFTMLPQYPADAVRGEAGTVTLRVTVDETGYPSEIQQVTGADRIALRAVDGVLAAAPEPGPEFARAAIDAVGRWIYAPPAEAPVSIYAQFAFAPGSKVRLAWHNVTEPPGSSIRPLSLQTSGPIAPADASVPKRNKYVTPEYPTEAVARKIEGVVAVKLTLDARGRVSDAQVVRSIPELDTAALDAVRQWEFTPALHDGEPAPVTIQVTVSFSLDTQTAR